MNVKGIDHPKKLFICSLSWCPKLADFLSSVGKKLRYFEKSLNVFFFFVHKMDVSGHQIGLFTNFQKKESHTGLEWLEGKQWTENFHIWTNYSFNTTETIRICFFSSHESMFNRACQMLISLTECKTQSFNVKPHCNCSCSLSNLTKDTMFVCNKSHVIIHN